mmetsp:Transcript_19228/g.48046  ORF Transcript_19228/g.48046 Transcript_19228/m.48046 type:complete len:216 (+) Transcript_19228:615-1262(+)
MRLIVGVALPLGGSTFPNSPRVESSTAIVSERRRSSRDEVEATAYGLLSLGWASPESDSLQLERDSVPHDRVESHEFLFSSIFERELHFRNDRSVDGNALSSSTTDALLLDSLQGDGALLMTPLFTSPALPSASVPSEEKQFGCGLEFCRLEVVTCSCDSATCRRFDSTSDGPCRIDTSRRSSSFEGCPNGIRLNEVSLKVSFAVSDAAACLWKG